MFSLQSKDMLIEGASCIGKSNLEESVSFSLKKQITFKIYKIRSNSQKKKKNVTQRIKLYASFHFQDKFLQSDEFFVIYLHFYNQLKALVIS